MHWDQISSFYKYYFNLIIFEVHYGKHKHQNGSKKKAI